MSDKPAKILMIIDQFYPIVGGAEQQALRMSRLMIARGHTVTVLTRQSRPDLKEYDELQGISIHRLPIIGATGASKLKSTFPAVRWLINNRDKYDIIHCHGINPLEWGALFASFITKKPYVIKIPLPNFFNYAGAKKDFPMPGVNSTGFSRRFIRPLFLPAVKLIRRSLIGRAGRIFAISPEIMKNLTRQGFDRVRNIPNGIDPGEFFPVNREEKLALRLKLNLPPDGTIFIYSGRLAIEKNIETLLRGWREATRENSFASGRLLLLGEGQGQFYSTEVKLKEYADQQNLSGVIFRGAVPDVREYLQAADCFVLPSHWEGMSNALLEAMACGIPAIASDIPGNQAVIVPGKSGLLFPTTDFHKLAFCLLKMNQDCNLRRQMGNHARQIAIEKFSLNKITDDILNEYQKIIA